MQPAPPFPAGFATFKFLLIIGVALVLFHAPNLRADAPPTTVGIQSTGLDVEGVPTFRLEWNAAPNTTYLIQSGNFGNTPGLNGTNIVWKTFDAIKPTGFTGSVTIRITPSDGLGSGASSEFFRVIVPRTEISSIEPAVIPPGVATTIYIIGQCFESNDVVRVDGVDVSGVIFLNGGMLECALPPQTPGPHLIELVRGSITATSFTITWAPPPASQELVLQGPPGRPLAAPRRPVGRITFKAKEGATLARGLTDQIRENDTVTFDVQEGKKGLNAVNVSRVDAWASVFERTTGGGGVSPFSGEVQLGEVDLAIPGRGLDFVWGRTYNSRIGRTGASANGWTFSYDIHLQQVGDNFVIRNGTGRADTFTAGTNGVYTCPEFFSEGTLTGGVFRLTFADTGYWEFNPIDPTSPEATLARIVDRNGNIISLNYDTSGRLTQIIDDLSRTNTVAYDTGGRLVSITDFSGRTVTYHYYVGLPGERGGAGDLKSVISPPVIGTPNTNDFPAGKITTYTYSKGYADDRENHLLLSVIDAAGKITHKYVYQYAESDLEFIRCISVQHGTNTPSFVKYLAQTPSPANQFATLRCVVNDSMGNVSEYFLDARGRMLRELKFTGRATPGVPVTDTENRPTGQLRVDDPPWFETQFSWNNDSLCTRVLMPRGDSVECVYESDFDPSTRPGKRADLRIVRQHAAPAPVIDADGDGLPDYVDPDADEDGWPDLTERVWSFEYDPRFGSDPSPSIFNQEKVEEFVKAKTVDLIAAASGKGWDGTFASGGRILNYGAVRSLVQDFEKNTEGVSGGFGLSGNETGDESGGFVTSGANTRGKRYRRVLLQQGRMAFPTTGTDPRGSPTSYGYDTHGNLTRRLPGRASFTPITLEQGLSHDALSYNPHGQLTAITNAADANGHRRVDTFSYYTNGPQAGYRSVVIVDVASDTTDDPVASTINYEYDPRGNVTRMVDPLGHDRLYTYNALDQLVQCQSPQLSGATAAIPPWRITTQFTYDSRNNLTHIRHEDRDQNGALATNPWWTTQFIYDDLSRAVGCWRDKDKVVLRCTSVSYDANNNVTLFRSGEAVNGNDPSAVVSFAYDERNMPYQITEAPGTTIAMTSQYDYDANGNVTRVSEGLEGEPSVTSMEYDGFAVRTLPLIGAISVGFKSVVKEGMGNVIAAFGEVEYSLMRAQGTTPLAASLKSRLLFVVDTSGSMNLISKITGPMGNVTTFSYDANDNLKIIRHFGQTNDVPGSGNIRLAESRHEYDGLDRRISSRTAFFDPATQAPIGDGESVTRYAYAPNGQCMSVTDALGRKSTFGYDTVGWLSSVSSDGAKSVTALFRDRVGNARSITQTDMPDLGGAPQVFSITNVYDPLNRRIRSTDNVGNTAQSSYNSRGLRVSYQDHMDNPTQVTFDGLGRPTLAIADINRDGVLDVVVDAVRRWIWDDNDRLVAEIDSNTNTTTYAYDSRGRLVTTTNADNTTLKLTWTPRSVLQTSLDANGTVVTYTHDLSDRLVSKSITPGPGVAATTTFEQFAYDGAGRMIMASNDVSRVEFSYDSMGNNTRVVRDGWQILAAFDKNGDGISVTYPSGLVVSNTYDVLRQVSSIAAAPSSSVSPATLATYAYDGEGRLAQIARSNGIHTHISYSGVQGVANAPDDFGWRQVSHLNHARAGGSPVIDQRRTAHDRNQNRTLRVQLVPFSASVPPRTNTFSYDGLSRMNGNLDSVLGLIRFYDLDAEGNRRFVTNGTTVETYTRDATLPEPADFQMNQYTTTPFDTREYDANGNLHSSVGSDGIRAYQFDYANRLVGVQRFDGSAFVPVVSFRYNALGQRISKTVPSADPTTPPATTYFVYGDCRSGEGCGNGFSNSKGVISPSPCKSKEICGNGIIETRQSGTLIDSFIHKLDDGLMVMRISAGGSVAHYHCDDLGNTLALTDGAGDVLERNDYGGFGEPQFLDTNGLPLVDINGSPVTSSPSGNPFLFRGMEWDVETGFYFEKSWPCRYEGPELFDPQTGQSFSGTRRGYGVNTRSDTYLGVDRARTVSPRCFGAYQPRPQSCNAQYNPKEIGIDKSVPWNKK